MTTVGNPKNETIQLQRNTVRDRWLPWIKATVVDDALDYQILRGGNWEACTIEQLKPLKTFAKLTLILPAHVCAYRIRMFPQHLLNAKELSEAVALDFPGWSPWGQQSAYCFSYEAKVDTWQVFVWVWDNQYAQNFQQKLPFCTHIIPELAWFSACVAPHPALLVVAEQPNLPEIRIGETSSAAISSEGKGAGLLDAPLTIHNYILLGEAGKIQSIARVTNHQAALRCWHGWGSPNLNEGIAIRNPTGYWHPPSMHMQALTANQNIPRGDLLSVTRLPGLRDWVDPSSYQTHLKYLFIILVSWMLLDAGVLNYQTQQIQQQLTDIRHSADGVLGLQERVEKSQVLTQKIQRLQQQQRIPEHMLAQLSTKIPNDIYVNIVQLEGDQLDLNGQGKQVTRLMVLLEKLFGVERVMLLNDVSRNPQTDEEIFVIRLILKDL